MAKREIILDTETTGLNLVEKDGLHHRIVEIGAVELINLVPTGKYYHQQINPERYVPQLVVDIHGLSDEVLKDKPVFKDIFNDFFAFIGTDSSLIMHNAIFDLKFLNQEFQFLDKPEIDSDRVVDTLQLARTQFPYGSISLNSLCERFDIDITKRTLHGALLDSQLLSRVYIELMGGVQTNIVFGGNTKNTPKPSKKHYTFTRRTFSIPEKDAKNHKKFMKKMMHAHGGSL